MQVNGLEALPRSGPVLIAGNHDSQMDPVAVGVAALGHRQIRALAKASLWDVTGLGPILNGMGQIPIERGKGDTGALDKAIAALREGACIGVFPEGTRSLGRELRARSGIGRLAEAVPEADVVCVRTNGSVDVVRLPKRPSISVEFYRPRGGRMQPGETAEAFSDRLLAELREGAPREFPGRKRKAAKHRAAAESS